MRYTKHEGREWYEVDTFIRARQGLHARPCVDLMNAALGYEGKVHLVHEKGQADVTSVMELLMQGLPVKTPVTLRVEKREGCEELASRLSGILQQDYESR